MDLQSAIAEWQALLGTSRVLLGDDVTLAYGADASGIHRDVPVALRVDDAGTLPDLIGIAQRHRVAVHPLSTGRNWGYGTAMPTANGSVIVDLSGLRKILHFDAELGVVTVEPGVTQGMLAAFLAEGDHPYMVPVTGAGPSCSLVGNALERGYGITPHADHFGAVTDLEAVLADGSVYKTTLREVGGDDLARLFKWGVGPHLAGLFTQSGFGIVTRMSIVLARRPECIKVCLFSLREDGLLKPAVLGIRAALSTLPGIIGAINLMNRHRVLAMTAPFPKDQLDASGMIPASLIETLGKEYSVLPWTGFATLYGSRRVVAAAQRDMRRALRGFASRLLFLTPGQAEIVKNVAQRLPGAAGRRLARSASTLTGALELAVGRPNETALPLAYWRNPSYPKRAERDPSRDGCGLIWYAPLVPMRADGVEAYVQMVRRVTLKYAMEPLITMTSISDKLFDSTVPLLFERDNEPAMRSAWACYRELIEAGKSLGCFPYRVNADSMALVAGTRGEHGLHARLRRSIDPGGIIAPGRY